MTPEPVVCVSRSSVCWRCGRLKKRRKNGSCNNGFSDFTLPRTAMLTTPGVTRESIGARLGTAAPPISGIGAAASAESAAGMHAATPLIKTKAETIRFIVVRALQDTRATGKTGRQTNSFTASIFKPARDGFKATAAARFPVWQQSRQEAANGLFSLVFLIASGQ